MTEAGSVSWDRYAVIDVETTGFNPKHHRIVEVACVLVDADRVVDRWATLVSPGIAIPQRATQIHGITNDMVANAPELTEVMSELRERCGSRIVAAHYAPFDLSFLRDLRCPNVICTMQLARALVPEAPNHKNQTLRQVLRIDDILEEELGAHRALDDAIVSAHILIACRHRFHQRHRNGSWEGFLRTKATVLA